MVRAEGDKLDRLRPESAASKQGWHPLTRDVGKPDHSKMPESRSSSSCRVSTIVITQGQSLDTVVDTVARSREVKGEAIPEIISLFR